VRFLLVDAILELESGSRAVGLKNLAMSEEYFADHFPEHPIMPGALVLEALVQLADWVVREASDFTVLGMASGFERIKFRRVTRPGDQLRLEVALAESDNGTHRFRAKAFSSDGLAASADLTLVEAPLGDYLDPAAARASLGLLRRDAVV
jgi:3-hydroxyacyl-[acyl-carrier-protein] dehydratase